MDTDRFDDLLRALVSGTSRRGVFAALTGSLLAAQIRHSDADASTTGALVAPAATTTLRQWRAGCGQRE